MASFSIRLAGLLDLPHVVRLAKAASEETGGWFGWTSDEAAARRFAGLMTGEPGWVLLAAPEGGAPCGVLIASVQQQTRSAMGEYLYVEPGERGSWAVGVLLRAHRKLMKLGGLTEEVVLAAPSRAAFWQEHGYGLRSVVLARTMGTKEAR